MRRAALVVLLAPCFTHIPMNAQQAGVPAKTAPDAEEQTILLSPFQVNASEDRGFVATSSLVGGRLSGDLKDTPAAYSVLTREFLDALEITSLSEASKWMVNTGTSVQNGTEEITLSAPVSLSFRGVGASGQQRNFFRMGVNYDSYNVDRYDQGRGPNAIVFGNGGIGGVATSITKVAMTGRAFEQFQQSYGSWNNRRTTVDINKPLGGRFALRANLLYQDRDGWKGDLEMERKKAATLAATWDVTRDTQLRAEAEFGDSVRNNPLFGLGDSFTGWDGTTVFTAAVNAAPSNPNARGVALQGSLTSPYFVYAPGIDAGILNLGGFGRTLAGGATTSTPIGGQTFVGPVLTANGLPTLPSDSVNGLPVSRFDVAIANSKFRLPSRDFYVGTSLPTLSQPYKTFTAFATHRVGELFLELSGNYSEEERTSNYLAANAFQTAFIDINAVLPSGAPNPRFLEPYNELQHRRFIIGTENLGGRLSAAYMLKNTPWGDFSFNMTGAAERYKQRADYTVFAVLRASDHRYWATQDQVRFRYYWSDGERPVSPPTSATFQGLGYVAEAVTDNSSFISSRTNTDNLYLQAASKGRLLKGRLHVLAAVRWDDFRNSISNGKTQGDYPVDWNGHDVFFKPDAPADWYSLSYQPKSATGVATGPAITATARPRDSAQNPLPQYAGDRFQDDYSPPDIDVTRTTYTVGTVGYIKSWLSAYANFATSFNPNSSRLKVDGSPFSPQTSSGVDFGFRAVAGTRLSLGVGTYRGRLVNEAFDTSGSLGSSINQMLNANVVGDLSAGGRNGRGLINVPSQFFDSREREVGGYELDLVGNPLDGMRILFNVAIARSDVQNPYRHFLAYWSANEATFRRIMADAGTVINAANFASVDPNVPAGQAPDAATAVTGWNFVQSTLANIVSGSQIATRRISPIANLFADYEFQGGLFRNVRLGGGVNYRGREVIGFRGADTIRDPANPAVAIDDPAASAYDPVYADAYCTGTFTVSYRRQLKRRTQMQLSLRIDNLFDYDKPRYYNTTLRPPGGDLTTPARVSVPNNFYYVNPRSYTASVSFKF